MQFFSEVTPNIVFRVLKDSSKIEPGMKKTDEREQIFGRIFGILAIFRSTRLMGERLPKETMNVVRESATEVLQLYQSKRWLREVCVQTFMTMLNNVHASTVPVILEITLSLFEEQKVTEEDEEELFVPIPLTPSSLQYLLQVKTFLHKHTLTLSNEDLQRVYWKNSEIEPAHLKSLMNVYRESTFTFPKVHPVWKASIDYLREVAPKPYEMMMDWWFAVTEHVMTTTAERRR